MRPENSKSAKKAMDYGACLLQTALSFSLFHFPIPHSLPPRSPIEELLVALEGNEEQLKPLLL